MPIPLDTQSQVVGRFAPSPTGRMHAGNIFSYMMAWLVAKRANGHIALRIEDLDPQRSKQEYADLIMADLETLGLTWDSGPLYQSKRHDVYAQALDQLYSAENIYPCFCTRADLHAASAPHAEEHSVYPGTCKHLEDEQRAWLIHTREQEGRGYALRIAVAPLTLSVDDAFQGLHTFSLQSDCGDFVVKRADGTYSYQLAVVVDDAEQGVNSVVRGVDLLQSTPLQMFLQSCLGFDTPQYAHVPLFVDERGRRIAKRNHDASLDELMQRYGFAEAVLGHIAYAAHVVPTEAPYSMEDLLEVADLSSCFHTSSFRWETHT